MIHVSPVRRLIYRSRALTDDIRADHRAILAVSRRNNGMDGVSGILWIADDRYVQLLEGPPDSIATTFARIGDDPRHTDIEILDDRTVADTMFGEWAMAGLPGDRAQEASERLHFLLRNAAPEVRRFFPVD